MFCISIVAIVSLVYIIMYFLFFSGAEHCPYDYIRIYDGKDNTFPVIGTFCGMGKFPYSIIGTSQDLFVEFVSSAAGKKKYIKIFPLILNFYSCTNFK